VAAVLSRRNGRLVLSLQAFFYVTAAAAASGLILDATLGLWSTSVDRFAIPLTSILALAAMAVVTFLPVRSPIESWRILASVLRCLLIAQLVWTAAGMSVAFVIFVLPGG